MQTKLPFIAILYLMVGCFGITFASKPTPPTVKITVNGNTVTAAWSAVSNASRYTLFYAPYPDISYIASADMGTKNSFAVTFAQDAAYYVAIKSVNNEGSSDYSNIEHFIFTASSDKWYKPAVGINWQLQLMGTVNTSYPAALYEIDLFDSSTQLIQSLQAQGKKVICYFSAGSSENWRSDFANFQPADQGNNLDGWPGERWLDIRSTNVHGIMSARLDLAKSKGCDGVDPDNVDGYANGTGLSLTASDQLAYNKGLAAAAHAHGLSIGLKNDPEQVSQLVDSFDFSVNEQCHFYNECDYFKPFIQAGKPVLNIEYQGQYTTSAAAQQALCQLSNSEQFSTLIMPLSLDGTFRFSCR
jgi:hypothetical protein